VFVPGGVLIQVPRSAATPRSRIPVTAFSPASSSFQNLSPCAGLDSRVVVPPLRHGPRPNYQTAAPDHLPRPLAARGNCSTVSSVGVNLITSTRRCCRSAPPGRRVCKMSFSTLISRLQWWRAAGPSLGLCRGLLSRCKHGVHHFLSCIWPDVCYVVPN
jgi:hypothetical protein